MDYRNKAKGKSLYEKEQVLYRTAVSFSKFFYFLCSPVLVFKTEYPRTEKIRVGYFLAKASQAIFHLVHLLYELIAA